MVVRRRIDVAAGAERGGSTAGLCAIRGDSGLPVAGDGVMVERRRLMVSAEASVPAAGEAGPLRDLPIARVVSDANRRGDGSLPASDSGIVGRFIGPTTVALERGESEPD